MGCYINVTYYYFSIINTDGILLESMDIKRMSQELVNGLSFLAKYI